MWRSVLTAESLITPSLCFCFWGLLHVRVDVGIVGVYRSCEEIWRGNLTRVKKKQKLHPWWNNSLIYISIVSDLLALYSSFISLLFFLPVKPRVRWRPWAILHWRNSNLPVSFTRFFSQSWVKSKWIFSCTFCSKSQVDGTFLEEKAIL